MKRVTERYLDSDIIIVILLLFTERRYILLTKAGAGGCHTSGCDPVAYFQ